MGPRFCRHTALTHQHQGPGSRAVPGAWGREGVTKGARQPRDLLRERGHSLNPKFLQVEGASKTGRVEAGSNRLPSQRQGGARRSDPRGETNPAGCLVLGVGMTQRRRREPGAGCEEEVEAPPSGKSTSVQETEASQGPVHSSGLFSHGI